MTSRCLSVVMPAYNEEGTILEAIDEVLASPWVAEVVVVDDSSTDRTAELLTTVDDARGRIVSSDVRRDGRRRKDGDARARVDERLSIRSRCGQGETRTCDARRRWERDVRARGDRTVRKGVSHGFDVD